MKSNMGGADRITRLIAGLAIAIIGYYYNSWWAFVALLPLGTAYLGYCPIYRSLGWSTVSKQRN